jgi:hypothetical protein
MAGLAPGQGIDVRWTIDALQMCHWCGCRQIPLIRDYITEHGRAINLGGGASVRAAPRSARLRRGGRSLFRVIGRALYADDIAALTEEHRELAELLMTVDVTDPSDQRRIRIAGGSY